MPENKFKTVKEALAYLEASKCEPLARTNGFGKQVYAVCPPGFSRYIDIHGDERLIGWANAYHWSQQVDAARTAAGWEYFEDEQESPSGEFGWHAPCGTHESDWSGPMPEEEAIHVAA